MKIRKQKISRRLFLKMTAIGAGSSVALMGGCRQFQPRGTGKIKIGMLPGGGCYRGQGFEETVRRIAKAGFDGVMLFLHEDFTRNNLAEINRILKGEGLPVLQVHPPWPNIGSADQKVRNSALDTYRRWIEYSRKIDAQTVIVHPSGADVPPDRNQALDLTVQAVRLMAGEASPMVIAVENVGPAAGVKQSVGSNPEELMWMVRTAGLSNIGICLDTSHCMASGVDLQSFITKAGPRIVTTHLHDLTLTYDPKKGGIKDEHLMFGMGKIDWEMFLSLLKANCPAVPWIAEIEVKGTPQEQERSFAEIANFLNKYH